MPKTATHPFIPRVGIVFDFDRTLATDSIDAICKAWGIERDEWQKRYCDPLGDHWDDIIKRGWALIQCGRDRGEPLSRDLFDRAAEHVDLYSGLDRLKECLTRAAQDVHEEIEVELVVLSAGFIEVIERTRCEELFDRTWAGSFHFDENGEALSVKRIISHPEKALYLEAYAKGLSIDDANEPKTHSPDEDPADMHVPFDQLVYVGDGLSDLDAFHFVHAHGGLAIAVDKDHEFDHADQQSASQRVENLAPPDYAEGSELLCSLIHAVTSCAARAALRKMGEGE